MAGSTTRIRLFVFVDFFFSVIFVQAHAKRVAAENKRTRRFALGGGFGGGRSRAARPKMGNSRGLVVKAFAADSDEEEESEEVSLANENENGGKNGKENEHANGSEKGN